MDFPTKFAIVVASDLPMWQKLNVVAFLSTGIAGEAPEIIGEPYEDGSGRTYSPISVQPIVILKADRPKLNNFLGRAERRGVKTALYIEDMFVTNHDEANRQTVTQYQTADLPLVGLAIRADRKVVDKIFKGAKLHD